MAFWLSFKMRPMIKTNTWTANETGGIGDEKSLRIESGVIYTVERSKNVQVYRMK